MAAAATSFTGCAQMGGLFEAPVDDASVATKVRAALSADPEVSRDANAANAVAVVGAPGHFHFRAVGCEVTRFL